MKVLKRLKDIPQNKKIFIYGTGNAGANLFRILKNFYNEIHIEAFLTSFDAGIFKGLKVLRFSDIKNDFRQDDLILIASMNWRDIKKGFKDAGIEQYFVIPPRFLVDSGYDRLNKNPASAIDNYLIQPLFLEQDKAKYSNELEKTAKLLKSKEERKLFELLWGKNISSRNKHASLLSIHYYDKEYIGQYYDFIIKKNISTIIEGGVFNGDETIKFLNQITGSYVFGFEPFYDSFSQGVYAKKILKSKRTEIINKGLWCKPGHLSLKGSGLSARLTENENGTKVEVESIDNFVKQKNIKKIDFIKLDVEGAEFEVLKGAKQTLINHRPQLAVCIYHLKEDYYRIPLMLNETLDNYSWHIGHYRASFFETVWYGIPKELK